MKLLNDITKNRSDYTDRLQQIAEQVDVWLQQISKEKRLGLKPLDQMLNEVDPYNTSLGTEKNPSDTIEFTPTNEPIAKPVQSSGEQRSPMRINLIYNPTTGQIERTVKTPIRSRPPAEYMEANADQITGALRHLEKMNPHLADLLVHGKMSVWIPRTPPTSGPSSVKHLGLTSTGTGSERNIKNMSSEELAKAHHAAQQMKIAKDYK